MTTTTDRASMQDFINGLDANDALAELQRQVSAQFADYPQYDGKTDNWNLARSAKTVSHRGRVLFVKGDFVLYNPESDLPDVVSTFVQRQGWFGIVDTKNIRPVV